MEKQGRLRKQRIEPTSGLVYRLTDKLCRELGLEELLVFKGIMVLRVRHGTAIKPAVDDFRYSLHLLSAVRAGKGQHIYIGLMKLNMLIAYIVGGIALIPLRLQLI